MLKQTSSSSPTGQLRVDKVELRFATTGLVPGLGQLSVRRSGLEAQEREIVAEAWHFVGLN